MRKTVLILLITLSIVRCKQNEENPTQDMNSLKVEINDLLDSWHKAAGKADYQNYFGALDSLSVYVGTDAAEVWNKKQFSTFSKPYFDRGNAWSFKALNRNIYFSKNNEVVWFDELLDTWMGLCRGSGVLEKTNNKWKIKHYVLSVTIPNDKINSVIKINKATDSIYKNNHFNN